LILAKIAKTFFLIVITFVSFNSINAQPTPEELFQYKEMFTFEVKYSFFKLGWVDVELLPDTVYNGVLHKYLKTTIRSNSKVPFIGVELDEFHSLFYINDDGIPVTSKYWKNNVDEAITEEIVYEFDRENNIVFYKEDDGSEGTMEMEEPATAGHVIFVFSRLFAGSNISSKQIVYISKNIGYLYFDNPSITEKRIYKPFDEPVEAVLTSGRTEDMEGPFGFSGNFRAWFLNDDLRVPLEARIRVFLGNVIIRLIDYKKEEL